MGSPGDYGGDVSRSRGVGAVWVFATGNFSDPPPVEAARRCTKSCLTDYFLDRISCRQNKFITPKAVCYIKAKNKRRQCLWSTPISFPCFIESSQSNKLLGLFSKQTFDGSCMKRFAGKYPVSAVNEPVCYNSVCYRVFLDVVLCQVPYASYSPVNATDCMDICSFQSAKCMGFSYNSGDSDCRLFADTDATYAASQNTTVYYRGKIQLDHGCKSAPGKSSFPHMCLLSKVANLYMSSH